MGDGRPPWQQVPVAEGGPSQGGARGGGLDAAEERPTRGGGTTWGEGFQITEEFLKKFSFSFKSLVFFLI